MVASSNGMRIAINSDNVVFFVLAIEVCNA